MVLATVTSCDEWEPVTTFKYSEPDEFVPVTMVANTSIADLKAMYVKGPLKIDKDIVIKGQVISSDRSGNVYRSIYIQDETGAIEVKLGKTSLYNDYKLGQWIYVKCSGLTLGNYEGMLQLGYTDPTGDYETAYIDVQYIIDTHVFRGAIDSQVQPQELTSSQILNSENFGKYVTIKGLKYGSTGSSSGEIFCLFYVDPNQSKDLTSNRIFLSDKTYGVTTWAMSKQGFLDYLNAGNFDNATTADNLHKVSEIKATLIKNAAALTVSQYFLMGSTEVQVRTSGYAKFADTQIDPAILDGTARVNLTGILTNYRGAAQFTLIDLGGVEMVN
jgi:DNA/RNA endonuclease YhcR with UshA esterase domain